MSTRWNTRGRLVLLAGPTVLVVMSGTALAASPWSTTGSGSGAAKSGSITAPGAPTVPGSTVTNGNVAVSWSGATGPSGATLKYFVERMVGTTPTAVCASTFAAPITATSCTDTGVPNGTYKYRVTTRLGSAWKAVSAESATVTVAAASLVISTVVRSAGNKKVAFTGTGAVATTNLVVTICTANSFPCSVGNSVGTSTVAPPSAGNWTSGQSSQNLNDSTNYYAQAVQGAATSAVFSFTVTAL